MNVEQLGWNDFFKQKFNEYENTDYIPARVVCEQKQLYSVCSSHGELSAEISGTLWHTSVELSDFPRVGDWVVVTPRLDEKKGYDPRGAAAEKLFFP